MKSGDTVSYKGKEYVLLSDPQKTNALSLSDQGKHVVAPAQEVHAVTETEELASHVRNQVFEAVTMFDATRRQILKHPTATQVVVERTEPSTMLVLVHQRGKRPPRVFQVTVSERI
jgi:uncharacterized protein (DUF2461 family)